MQNFRLKICGITRWEDALLAVEAGADALGFNFSQVSKRRVDVTTAAQIIDRLRQRRWQTVCVGVFVEHSADQARRLAAQAGLDLIQLHGDHALADLEPDFDWPVLWVSRLPATRPELMAARLAGLAQQLVAFRSGSLAPDPVVGRPGIAGLLVDAYSPDDYGGTGQTLAWEPLGQRSHWLQLGWTTTAWPQPLPLVLAGGLTPENVATAIQQAQPDGIDVASGVEQSPGIKSAEKIHALIAAAKQAWRDLPAGQLPTMARLDPPTQTS
jgi:phosphoribosylanthranilate isomerase